MTHQPRQRLTPGAETPARERGAALVIVMIFMIGILAMLAYLIPTSHMAVVAQTESERHQHAQLALQAAVNDVIYEIRRGYDLDSSDGTASTDGDGYGARGTGYPTVTSLPGVGGGKPGVAVLGPGGGTLGYYMAIAERDDTTNPATVTVHVVAGVPDLEAYDTSTEIGERKEAQRLVLGAQIRVEIVNWVPFGDRNALAFAGPVTGTSGSGSGNIGFQGSDLTAGNSLDVTVEPYVPEGETDAIYPMAVNISDPLWYDTFIDEVVYDNLDPANVIAGITTSRAALSGASATDNTSDDYHYEYTVGQQPSESQIVNEDLLIQLAEAWRAPGDSTLNTPAYTWSGTGSDADDDEDADGLQSDGNLVYISHNSTFSGEDESISGSGTLVIKGKATFKNGASLDWDGDVIVAPDGTDKGIVTVDGTDGTSFTVRGNMVFASDPEGSGEASLELIKKATLNVEGRAPGTVDADGNPLDAGGTLMVLQGGTSSSTLNVRSGSGLNVDGVMGVLGNNIAFETFGNVSSYGQKTTLDVNGSLVIAVPEGSSGIQKFKIGNDSEATLHFENSSFDSGVANAVAGPAISLNGFNPPPEAYFSAYMETGLTGDWRTTFDAAYAAGDADADLVGVSAAVAGQ